MLDEQKAQKLRSSKRIKVVQKEQAMRSEGR